MIPQDEGLFGGNADCGLRISDYGFILRILFFIQGNKIINQVNNPQSVIRNPQFLSIFQPK